MPTITSTTRSATNRNLIERYQQGDRQAADDLLRINAGLIVKQVRRVVPYCSSLDAEDLLQEGRLGLLTAARSFDLSRGLAFSTHAYFWIRQAIQRAVHGQDRLIRLPDHVHTKRQAGDHAQPLSLDQQLGDDLDRLGELIADDTDVEARVLEEDWARSVLEVLPPKLRRVVELRLAGESLADIGRRLYCSRENVRMLYAKGLALLRESAPTH